MNNRYNTPEELIPDDENYFERNNQLIRKGTMAATITNADILESNTASENDKKSAIEALKILAPKLNAFGLNKHFYWRNKTIQAIFDQEENII